MENEANKEAQKEVVALQILISAEGIRLAGPALTDELACYGLLKKVEQMIADMHKPKIVKPMGGLMKFANGRH